MIQVKEHSTSVSFFTASSKTVEVKADTVRPVVIVKYNVPQRTDSFLLPRDPLLIGELADALSMLYKRMLDGFDGER